MSDDVTTKDINVTSENTNIIQAPDPIEPVVDISEAKNLSEKDFWYSVLEKILESVTSVKVWMWAWPFAISTALAYLIIPSCKDSAELINLFNAWCTFNLGLTGTVVVVREVFKVEQIKRIDMAEDDVKADAIKKIKV
jgi:hypothetical protein